MFYTSGIFGETAMQGAEKVMLERDLAALYGVETKMLNHAVKRNTGASLRILCFN